MNNRKPARSDVRGGSTRGRQPHVRHERTRRACPCAARRRRQRGRPRCRRARLQRSDFPVEAGVRALRNGPNSYGDSRGVASLRKALAERVAATSGLQFDADHEVTITGGASAPSRQRLLGAGQPARCSGDVRAVLRVLPAANHAGRRHRQAHQPARAGLDVYRVQPEARTERTHSRAAAQHAAQPHRSCVHSCGTGAHRAPLHRQRHRGRER